LIALGQGGKLMAHGCSCGDHAASTALLDVREMPPRIRHPKIFETFDALPAGGAFVLVNDHDPKPLFYQFQAERAGVFAWRYLEQGPEAWRVEISRLAAAVEPGDRVGDLVRRAPAAAAALQRLGIDHCCSAGLTLGEVAAAAGLDVEAVREAVADALRADAPART
jgi:regulator of cell morphogenesis and NO signaling